MKERPWVAPVVVLLMLMLAYVGSYFALVTPGGYVVEHDNAGTFEWPQHYRAFEKVAAKIFRPFAEIDRMVRPDSWSKYQAYRMPDKTKE